MPRDTFIKRDKAQSPAHRRAPKQEQAWAKRTKGRLVPGSGSGYQKGDVRVKGTVRIENKTTSADSFRVTRKMISKITDAGMLHDEVPAMVIEFLDEAGNPEEEVAVIPTWALEILIMRLNEADGET